MDYINQHLGGGEINKGGVAKSARGGCVPLKYLEIGGDEDGMEEIRDIRDIPAKIQESKKITPIRKRQTQGNKKQFAQEINRYLRKKNKNPLPELKEDGIKNRKRKGRTSEEGKGEIIDVKV